MKKQITQVNTLQELAKARQEAMALFSGIRHRYESIGEWNGLEFIDDSKSTDLGSTLCSLEMTIKPVHWIIGETDLTEEVEDVIKQMKYKVVSLSFLGKDDTRVRETFAVWCDHYLTADNMDTAIQNAMRYAQPGGVILFSPACPSHDLFEDYKTRGESFRSTIQKYMK